MTPKQERFAQNIVNGMNQSDAYRDAYDADGMKDTAIWQEASTLAGHPQVSLRIQEGNQAIVDAALMTRSEVVSEAKKNLEQSRNLNQMGPANGALKLAAELSGLTTEAPRSDVRITQVTIVMPGVKEEVIEAEYEVKE